MRQMIRNMYDVDCVVVDLNVSVHTVWYDLTVSVRYDTSAVVVY